MKNVITTLILILSMTGLKGQESTIPAVQLTTLEGKQFNSKQIDHDGPVILFFWASWCKSSKEYLDNVSDVYEDWQDETDVKIYAISYDDQRSVNKVKPMVNSAEWEFEILLDKNGDFKRAMGVNQCPHIILLNDKKEKVYQHTGYTPGDEDLLLEKLNQM